MLAIYLLLSGRWCERPLNV